MKIINDNTENLQFIPDNCTDGILFISQELFNATPLTLKRRSFHQDLDSIGVWISHALSTDTIWSGKFYFVFQVIDGIADTFVGYTSQSNKHDSLSWIKMNNRSFVYVAYIGYDKILDVSFAIKYFEFLNFAIDLAKSMRKDNEDSK